MFYITNARIGGYYFRDPDDAQRDKRERVSGFRTKFEDASKFATAAAAQAVIETDALMFSAVVEFSDAQVAAVVEKKEADAETHAERSELYAEHFDEQQAAGLARDLAEAGEPV